MAKGPPALEQKAPGADCERVRFPAVVIAAMLTLAPATSAATRPLGANTDAARQRALESQIVQAINVVRRGRGLRPLTVSTKLAAAAAQHTREMGVDGYFDHDSFNSTPFWKRIERWYPSTKWSSWSVGENIEYETPDLDAQQSVTIWMNSPPHRANLLSRTWREIGISAMHFDAASGPYAGKAVTIVTADFGARR